MREPETFVCDFCHEEHPIDARNYFDDLVICDDCLDNETTICDCCNNRIWIEDSTTDGNITLCSRCYERHYTNCTNCDSLIRFDDAFYLDDEDDAPYCSSCIARARVKLRTIQSYGYKPAPIFYGDGLRFFGVELEIDGAGEDNDSAADLMQIANETATYAYCKHDGSLSDGFEIVTHPMTLEYHQTHMPWAEVMERAVCLGYLSHQAGSCGLHIHVNRDSFGSTDTEQEAAISRVLFFVENHWNELLRFSRRTESQMRQWAARYGRKDNPKEQMEHVKSHYSDRYRAVNLTNSSTIEFRMFRGTLRYNTLIATLQLVNEICDVACYLSDDEMAALSWSDFMARIGSLEMPELVQYLKERRLFVCEPVDGEVEV